MPGPSAHRVLQVKPVPLALRDPPVRPDPQVRRVLQVWPGLPVPKGLQV